MQRGIQDHILLKLAIHNKDKEALGRLHSIYYSRIKHYIASRVDLIENVEDLAQSVFLELCKGNGRYDDQRDAEAYLFGMARNLVSHSFSTSVSKSSLTTAEQFYCVLLTIPNCLCAPLLKHKFYLFFRLFTQ